MSGRLYAAVDNVAVPYDGIITILLVIQPIKDESLALLSRSWIRIQKILKEIMKPWRTQTMRMTKM